jgi:hypothetical protein
MAISQNEKLSVQLLCLLVMEVHHLLLTCSERGGKSKKSAKAKNAGGKKSGPRNSW